jgi:hypothetical protein
LENWYISVIMVHIKHIDHVTYKVKYIVYLSGLWLNILSHKFAVLVELEKTN